VFMVAIAQRSSGDTFSGTLYRQRDGLPFHRIAGVPPSAGVDGVGMVTFQFEDGEHGRFIVRMGANERTYAIQRMRFGVAAATCEVERD
jgi:hypothetical protein